MQTPRTGRTDTRFQAEDLDSSPLVPAPELHAEIFDSPARAKRIPGVSVLTPAKKNLHMEESKGEGENVIGKGMPKKGIWDSDSDDEDEDGGLPEGMSPPKTMQFHIPQSKLLKTPGKSSYQFAHLCPLDLWFDNVVCSQSS